MPNLGFGRSKRLLTKAAYKAVFDHSPYRVSHRNLLLLARPNGLKEARLGLIVAKKNVRLAVGRNRIKRVVRDSFRLNQQSLSSIDIIFLARRGLDRLEPAVQQKLLLDSWRKLSRQISKV
ncbi:MAG: ribonuclease P protein component [Gammaproteobacteria bacterium]|nr:ribonuclease P protein component [Gammaproteobacteria bacterium]MBQ0839269.1 ribonuclease P protein component [Gammaproteobacteria bacterium]